MKRNGGATLALVLVPAFLLFGLNTTETAAMPEYVSFRGGDMLLGTMQNSFYVLVAIALRFYFGPLSDRRGPRFAMIVGACGFLLPCIALLFFTDLPTVIALHIVQAIGLAAFHPNVMSYLTDITAPERLGTRLGVLRATTTASAMLGPLLLFPIIEHAGYPAFFGALTLAAAIGAVGTVCLPQAPRRRKAAQMSDGADTAARAASGELSFPRASRTVRACLILLPCIVGVCYSIVLNSSQSLMRANFPGANDGVMLSLFSAGGLAGSLVAGRACEAFGPSGVIVACIASLASGLAALSLPFAGIGGAMIAAAFAGAGYSGAIATCSAAGGMLVPERRRGSFFAMQQSGIDLGIVIGGFGTAALLSLGLSIQDIYQSLAAVAAICIPLWFVLYRPAKIREG